MIASSEGELGGPLRFRVWVTRGCYFTLAERMSRKARYSVGATTLLSFYVVILSLVTLAFPDKVSPFSSKWITTSSLIISIFIIIITLMENSKNYVLKAEHASQSARDLAFLFNQMEDAEPGADEKAHIKRYNEILSEARVGHAMIDYNGFQLSNSGEFQHGILAWSRIVVLYIANTILEYWAYALMTLGPLIPISNVILLIVDGKA